MAPPSSSSPRFAMIPEIFKARMCIPSPYGQYPDDEMLASPSPFSLEGRFFSRLADLLASDMIGLQTSPTGEKLAPIGPPVTRLMDLVRSQALASSPCHSLLTRFSNRANPRMLETEASFVRSQSLPHHPNTGFVPMTVKKVLRPGGLAALAGKRVVRGTPCAAICSVSARLAHSFVCRRSYVTQSGLGKKTSEELMVWEKTLEQRSKNMDAEEVELGILRSSLGRCWVNLGVVDSRAIPSGRYSLLKLKTMVRELLDMELQQWLRYLCFMVPGSLFIIYSLKPGEASTIPGNILQAATNEARSTVLLPEDGINPPALSSPPKVVILDGSRSFRYGKIWELPTTGSSPKVEGCTAVGTTMLSDEDLLESGYLPWWIAP